MGFIIPNMGKRKKLAGPLRRSLADALFSTTKQRILVLIFGQPERRFFASELIALAGKGSGSVQRELAVLSESGIVTIETVGKQKFYQANQNSPIFQELEAIVMKTVGLAAPLQKALERRKDIEHAFVFGSIAKGSDRASSDIDLFVISESLSLTDLYELVSPVEKQLGRKINCSLYSPLEFRQKQIEGNSFIVKVLQGEKIPLIGDQDVLTRKPEESR